MKILLLVTMSLLFSTLIVAQENYQPGSVTTKSGEKIDGFVDFRDWANNPKKVFFKKNIDDEPIKYQPVDLAEFKVNDECYVGAVVFVENSTRYIDVMKESKKFVIDVDTVFLQTIISGEKSLYYYNKTNGIDNFYIYNNDKYELLLYKKYIAYTKDHNIGVSENMAYRNQLMMYLMDCDEVQSNLTSVKYEYKSLASIFLKYYKCSDSTPDFKKDKKALKGYFGVVGGCSFNVPSFDEALFKHDRESDGFSTSITPTIGITYNLVLPRSQGKWSFYNELVYWSYNYDATINMIDSESIKTDVTTRLGYQYIKLSNMLRFNYPFKEQVSLFANAGFSNAIAINETDNFRSQRVELLSYVDVDDSEAVEKPLTYNQAYAFGVGATCEKFSLETRIDKNFSLFNPNFLVSTTMTFYLLLAYEF